MKVKILVKVVADFVVTGVAVVLIYSLSPLSAPAQTKALPNWVHLTIEVQSAYNPGLRICTPIAVGERVELAWSRGLVRSSIFALVSKPQNGSYPVRFSLKEGMLDYERTIDLQPDLQLEKPHEKFTGFSGGFEIGHRQILRLSIADCNGPRDSRAAAADSP